MRLAKIPAAMKTAPARDDSRPGGAFGCCSEGSLAVDVVVMLNRRATVVESSSPGQITDVVSPNQLSTRNLAARCSPMAMASFIAYFTPSVNALVMSANETLDLGPVFRHEYAARDHTP